MNEINPTSYRHTHNGVDSPRVNLTDLQYTQGAALTTANSGTLSTGGGSDLKTADSLIIDNMRTRINQLEARLQALLLIQ